jgi:hypothetical protein
MAPPTPPSYPLVFPKNRARITQEPPAGKNAGDPTRPLDIDWSAGVTRAGGPFPELFWRTNPKENQDRVSAG